MICVRVGFAGSGSVRGCEVSVTLAIGVASVLDADSAGLLEAARRGDDAAQATIFELHKRAVARQILRLTGDTDAVDDLVQEVFIAAFRRLPEFRGEAQLETWLNRIALNKVRNHWDSARRRTARERKAARRDGIDRASPESHAGASEKLQRFYAAVAELPPKLRDAFALRAVEGLSLDDASERLGVPVSTVSYRARRAEALLCRALGLEETGNG